MYLVIIFTLYPQIFDWLQQKEIEEVHQDPLLENKITCS